jgi:addiction module HigA family antidote
MGELIPIEHPGVLLKDEFLVPLGLTAYRVSKETGINETALGQILKGKRSISPLNGLKLARFFGLSDDYFVRIQMRYDLDNVAEKEKESLGRIVEFVPQRNHSVAQ